MKSILQKVDASVYLFGSRARKNARPDSDLDICIKGVRGEIPLEVMDQLREDFINSSLPYHVDLVDYMHLNEMFLQNIEAEFIQLK
ncbi:MAG: nucleotidyltransferase domain-containing protein [Proteobacteria bacterium]|nr:nucleotidyltransferase domain-containing protein [Pseudomonadota bacterium]